MSEATNTSWETLLSIHDRLSFLEATLRRASGIGHISRIEAVGLADFLADMRDFLAPIIHGDLELPPLGRADKGDLAGQRRAALFRAEKRRLSRSLMPQSDSEVLAALAAGGAR